MARVLTWVAGGPRLRASSLLQEFESGPSLFFITVFRGRARTLTWEAGGFGCMVKGSAS